LFLKSDRYSQKTFFGIKMKLVSILVICSGVVLTGCASTYGNLVSGSQLGAAEYKPSVLVNQGMDSRYQEVLGICRNVATNRQITAAQEAQLKTITGVGSGALSGAATGMQFGSILKQAGFGGGVNRSTGIGLVTGALSGLAGAFKSGTENGASETKLILLNCLRAADPAKQTYVVLE
jgi:hypothetical protein